ncbi:MAG TPA: hypothetical protein VGM94_07525 [Galbitalea sp.]
MSMRTAAQQHGWGLKQVPALPDVTFARTRRLDARARAMVVPHWSEIDERDVTAGATGVQRTLIDCMRMLPLDESLPILDSAVRADDVSPDDVRRIADSMNGRGRTRARGVAALVDGRCTNPFESTLRAIGSTVPGLGLVPQLGIKISERRTLHPDLADPALGLIVEAESFAWHGKSAALTRDCWRYNTFTLLGWTVIRFSWFQVMQRREYVLGALEEASRLLHRHANVARGAVDRPL